MATLTTQPRTIRSTVQKGKAFSAEAPKRPSFWTILMRCLAAVAV
jgi:hypothetical protein